MFTFINMSVPFRDLTVVGGSASALLSLRHHARVLAFAGRVQYRFSRKKFWRRQDQFTWPWTRPWTVAGQSFQFTLSVLQTSTSLRILHLVYAELKPSHQLVILSIPTLNSLVLEFSHFAPTVIDMPLSSITSLTLLDCCHHGSIEHTIRLLRNTLEILEVRFTSVDIPLILETVQPPHLTCVTIRNMSFDTSGFTKFTPRASGTITKLCIIIRSSPYPLGLSDHVFPQLRELSSSWWIAVQLVPRRPVKVFYDVDVDELKWDELETNLALLSQSTRGIKELRLYTSLSIDRVLQLLAAHVPRLQRLYLWTIRDRPFGMELRRMLIERNLNALTEVHVTCMCCWTAATYFNYSQSIFPALSFQVFPALEVVQLSAGVYIPADPCNWPSVRKLKLHRIRAGEWEESI